MYKIVTKAKVDLISVKKNYLEKIEGFHGKYCFVVHFPNLKIQLGSKFQGISN